MKRFWGWIRYKWDYFQWASQYPTSGEGVNLAIYVYRHKQTEPKRSDYGLLP